MTGHGVVDYKVEALYADMGMAEILARWRRNCRNAASPPYNS